MYPIQIKIDISIEPILQCIDLFKILYLKYKFCNIYYYEFTITYYTWLYCLE